MERTGNGGSDAPAEGSSTVRQPSGTRGSPALEGAGAPREALAPDIVQTTRGYVEMHRARLRAEAAAGRGGVLHAGRVAAVFDGLLSAYFLGASARARASDPLPGPVALLAVGGYGRGALGLGSDLDVILVSESVEAPSVHRLAETLLYPLWDAGVSVGHAVRTPDELVQLAREDLRSATTLLDARVIAGDAAFGLEAASRAWRVVFGGDTNRFLDALEGEMQGRHARYGGSVYLLEPDVKHGRGALRDLDIARWALRARYHARDFKHALELAVLSSHDAAQLEAAREFVWRVRGVLHAHAGRRSDRLTFDEQEECARAFGLVDAEAAERDPLNAVGAAAERLMTEYYQHARTVATTLDRLLDGCRVARSAHGESGPRRADRIGDELERFDGAVHFTEAESVRRTPSLALRACELALRHRLPLSPRAREVIAQCAREASWAERLREDRAAGPVFLRLIAHTGVSTLRARGAPVSASERSPSVLAELHDLGLLLAMVPEFGPVTGRVHHDVYHTYTVDVHSVAAVDRLHRVARGEMGESYALAARVLAELERRDLLCLGTLLHDVGKGRGGDHSAIGAGLAVSIAKRLGLTDDDAHEVGWLVREHLALYHYATRRDVSDPATLAQVLARVRDPWRLRALFMLTVADLSTTSPTAMTSWKSRMLDELLRRAEGAMARADLTDAVHVDEQRRHALSCCSSEGDALSLEAFWASMPPRYVFSQSGDAMLRHARALANHRSGEPGVFLFSLEGASADLLEVLVVAPDRPGLLARLCALLLDNRLDVQSAQLYSRTVEGCREAVDVFVVRRLDDDPGGLVRVRERLPRELPAALEAAVESTRVRAEAPRFSRPEPAVRAEVGIDDRASENATVIEAFGRDRPGFLHAVAQALFELGLTIVLAKVNTEGRRAADVFYVTDTNGAKVDPARHEAIRARLLRAVQDERAPEAPPG